MPDFENTFEKSQSIKEIATALSKFQWNAEAVSKDSNNPFFKSKYASLDTIIATIRKPLADNGLSFSQFPTGNDQLTTILMHTSGEWLQSNATMHPKDNTPQSQGSAITYMRRYALSAILGIATEEDDDGNEATGKKAMSATTKPAKATVDAFTQAVQAVNTCKSIGELAALGERIDKSTKLNIDQKDKLDKMIGSEITRLEGNIQSHT